MDYRTPAEVGAAVAELRRRAGLRQSDVATHLGIDRAAVEQIERGDRRLGAWELSALAELLRVEPGLILHREEPAAALLRAAGADEQAVREALVAFELVVREVLGARALEELLGPPPRTSRAPSATGWAWARRAPSPTWSRCWSAPAPSTSRSVSSASTGWRGCTRRARACR